MSKYDKYKESVFTHEVMQPMVIDGDDLTVAYMAGYADAKDKYVAEIKRLREALRKCLPVMRKSHDRIHCLPRTSDTDLAEAIDITLGVARAALGEKE